MTTNLLVKGTAVEQTVRTPYAMSTAAVFGALLTAAAAAAFRRGRDCAKTRRAWSDAP